VPRFFNAAGPCDPDDHYMLPSERRVPRVRQLVEQKLYFVIHSRAPDGQDDHLPGAGARADA
jgi:hypothetical protein